MSFFYQDGFQKNAAMIQNQIIEKGYCSKAQLEFLMLYNEQCEFQNRLLISQEHLETAQIFQDKHDGNFVKALKQMHQIIMKKDAGNKFDKATEQDAFNILEDLFNSGPRANKEKIMEEGIQKIGKHQKTVKREQRYLRDRQGN